jgi:hypothetical protein
MRDETMQTLIRITGTLATLIAGVIVLSMLGMLPIGVNVDTDERRHYVLYADTSIDRAVIDVHVRSNVRGIIRELERQQVNTTWQYAFWAEVGEVVTIRMRVETYGQLPRGEGAWARCNITRDGDMVDTEVDQRSVVRDDGDRFRQASAACSVTAG